MNREKHDEKLKFYINTVLENYDKDNFRHSHFIQDRLQDLEGEFLLANEFPLYWKRTDLGREWKFLHNLIIPIKMNTNDKVVPTLMLDISVNELLVPTYKNYLKFYNYSRDLLQVSGLEVYPYGITKIEI